LKIAPGSAGTGVAHKNQFCFDQDPQKKTVMKKYLPLFVSASLLAASSKADVLFYEGFNYVNGPTIAVSTNLDGSTNWFKHSGTASPSDSIINNNHIEISATGGTLSRQDDVHRNITNAAFTNSQTVVYASFTVCCTNLPPATGTYFAHFFNNNTNFSGRVFAQLGKLANNAGVTNTWRLGVSGAAGAVNKIFPMDLATNVYYQVVVQWDPVSTFSATLWVNPLSSSDTSVVTADAVAFPPPAQGYAFRQPSSFGNAFFNVTNLAVASTWDEAATNVWSTNAVAPVIISSPVSRTNFVGDAVSLVALASGQGALTYQWQKDNANVANANGNSNVFGIASAAISDTGNYQMIATTPFGLSATSAVAFLWITNPPVPPTFTMHPSNTTVFYHQTASLHAIAIGPPPITLQWYYTNAPATGANVSDDGLGNLTITDVQTNNGTAGPYYVVASNPYGSKTSAVATVTAAGPPSVSIAFLRTLVDPVNFIATNSSLRWTITNVTVTTLTNITSGDTSSYYVQDATAGINIFTTHGSNFRPAQGTVLDFTGWLSSFNSTLELEGDTNDLTTGFFVHTNNDGSPVLAALPAPRVIPFNITNNLALCEYSLESTIVMITNVYFGANAGLYVSNTVNPVIVTNAAGETFALSFSVQDLDVGGNTLPDFAWAVVGLINQNLGNAVSPRNQGYQLTVTRFSDIITSAPPAATIAETHSGNNNTLTWQNVAWDNLNYAYASNYSYSVLSSTDVNGPYSPHTAYRAVLIGVNEVPANGATGIGFGTVSLSADQSTITVDEQFSGLSANATASHIHGPAGPGTNAAVLFPFTGVPTAKSGQIPQQTFAITPTQLGYLQNGLLYMNVHDATFPGGEIRGQLLLVPATGLTSPNSSFTNTSATTSTYIDTGAAGLQKYYKVVSP
jgi:hypothetical protein